MFSSSLLWSLRDELPMPVTLKRLEKKAPYTKAQDGALRFVCPYCQELLAVLNPKINLAHCCNCRKNINNIDLMIALGYLFTQAVHELSIWLEQYQRERPVGKPTTQRKRTDKAEQLGEILFRELAE